MNHPEIPPNCDEWFDADVFKPHVTNVQPSLNYPGEWRPIIAAFAEVAWIRIAEVYASDYLVIFNKYMTDRGLTDDERTRMYDAATKRNAAQTQSSAWRAWGEVK